MTSRKKLTASATIGLADEIEAKPEPSADLKAHMEEAVAWVQAQRERAPLPQIARTADGSISPPHNDAIGWAAHLCMALGTTSTQFVSHVITQLGRAPGHDGSDLAVRDNVVAQGLAFITSQEPATEMETLLLVQMFNGHRLAMQAQRLAGSAEQIPQMDSYVGMATKLGRLYVEQAQALGKIKSGGKQQVEVRYVYIDARTQTVVASPGGVGGQPGMVQQPHEPAALAYAPGPPLWSEDAAGRAMPVAGNGRAEAVSATRRKEHWRTSRRAERQLPERPVHNGDVSGQG